MHDEFADWYRPCTTGTENNLTEDLLIARWKGIEKLANDPAILDLVRVTLQRTPVDGGFLGRFRAVFKEADATFPMSGNDLELSVLAGSVLGRIFDQSGKGGDQGALGLICAVGVGGKMQAWSEPFVSNAVTYLNRRIRERRKDVKVVGPQFNGKPLKAQIDTIVSKWAEPGPASEVTKELFEVHPGGACAA